MTIKKVVPFRHAGRDPVIVLVLLALLGWASALWIRQQGFTLYFGDAQAHLNIARRILDSRDPGFDQLGTVWLPLPHLLMLPLVRNMEDWQSGWAGAVPSLLCYTLAGLFLYLAIQRLYSSRAAAVAATACFALNPNLLYLQATPMTEPIFFAALHALLYGGVWYAQTRSPWALAWLAIASNAACLTRYEGWFLLPFLAIAIVWWSRPNRHWWLAPVIYCGFASLAPLSWLAHNAWYYGNPLEFANGPYSARAIYQRALDSGMARYAGDHDFSKAALYLRTAAVACTGIPLACTALIGICAALVKRTFWPVFFLLLTPLFYIWSIYGAAVPIFVPMLWPHSYYNTRYALAVLPLAACAVAALVSLASRRWQTPVAALLVLMAVSPWLWQPHADAWIVWKESQVNSDARRAWTREAAAFMQAHYQPGTGILTSFGDLTGIFQTAGIPLRETIHEGNDPLWTSALARPDLYLRTAWAVAIAGDSVATALQQRAPQYRCVKMIAVPGAPVIEIYQRQ